MEGILQMNSFSNLANCEVNCYLLDLGANRLLITPSFRSYALCYFVRETEFQLLFDNG